MPEEIFWIYHRTAKERTMPDIFSTGVFTKMHMDEASKHLHIVAGELAPDDFDKSGKMTMWKLSKYLQGCRLAYLIHCPWFNVKISRAWVRSQKIDYLPTFSKIIDHSSSLKVDMWMSYIGKTSFIWNYIVTDEATGIEVAKAETMMVFVNVATRRPIAVPKAAYDRLVKPDPIPPQIAQFPSRPDLCYKFKLNVASSDTDFNQHTNQAVYMRMCMDAVSAGALQGQFSFPKEVVYYNPRSASVNYLKESRMGERLEIVCWEDRSNPICVCFEVMKGPEVICQCQLEFDYDKSSKL